MNNNYCQDAKNMGTLSLVKKKIKPEIGK